MRDGALQPAVSGGEQGAPVGTYARGTVLVMVITFFGLGANYLYGIYVARQLGAETFGLYAIGLSMFNVLAILSVMGLDSAVLHFVPGAWAQGRVERARSALRSALRVGALAGGIAGVALWGASAGLAHHVFSKEALAEVLRFFAIAIPAYAVSTILLSGLQALHDVKGRMAVKYVSEPAMKFALTSALVWAGWGLDGVLTAVVLALWVSVVLAWWTLQRRMKITPPRETANDRGKVDAGTVAAYAMPLLAGMVFNVLATRSDILLIGYFLSAAEAGVYAAALQTAGIIAIVLQSVESVIAPPLSEAISRGVRAEILDIYRLSLRWAVMIGTPLLLVAALWPAEIIGVFGHAFHDGAAAFLVLALAQFVNIATGSANYVLLLSGRSRVVMTNEIINGTLQIALNLYLIPRHGILGAALAVLLSVTTVNVLRLVQVRRHLGIQPYAWILIKPMLAASAAYGGALAVGTWMGGEAPVWLMPLVVMVYVASLLVLGLHDQDRAALASVFAARRRIAGQ